MNLKTNGIQHIGLPTDRFDETCAFYKGLGFVCRHENAVPGGGRVAFYELDGSFMMEIYEEQKVAGMSGAIDHIALDCTDIEAAYTAANDAGLRVVSNGIEALAFWKNGVRFFIVEGPNKERVEFCQML